MKLCAEKASPRFDLWLTEEIPGLSRSRARELCKAGFVRVNGVPMRGGAPVFEGSVVEILATVEAPAARDLPEHAPLSVLFEDEYLLIVDKPRGVSTVTLTAEDAPTLADSLFSSRPECREASPDRREAGLVQRLDFWTGGALLAAKKRDVWELLRQELFDGKIEKSYLALVEGHVEDENFTVYLPLLPSSDGKKMLFGKTAGKSEIADQALDAETEISVVSRFSGSIPMSLVRAKASRARRHQIRAHLAYSGHPLLGDELYGAKRRVADFGPAKESGIEEGFLLHAEYLRLEHPTEASVIEVRSAPVWGEQSKSD